MFSLLGVYTLNSDSTKLGEGHFDDFVQELNENYEKVQRHFSSELANRQNTFGIITEQLRATQEQTRDLMKVTKVLSEA